MKGSAKVVVFACFGLAFGCDRPQAAPLDAGEPASQDSVSRTPSAAPDAAANEVRAGDASNEAERMPGDGGVDLGLDLTRYATAHPVWGKSIGHTSVVFKLKLEGGGGEAGFEAAYKPRSHRGNNRYRGEIAAYRLGRALGLTNVPPAIPRSFPAAELKAVLGDPSSGAGKLFLDEVVADDHGEVHGALIPWIVGLQFLSLEAEPRRSEWRGWLSESGRPPVDKETFAAQISDMIVFDYLTGNWDRWSGGNIGADATGKKVLFIDNDGAFFDPPPAEPLAKQRELLRSDHYFSKSFIVALRALDADTAKRVMAEDVSGEPLLSARVLAGLEERRKEALSIVDAKIAKFGESRTLAFE